MLPPLAGKRFKIKKTNAVDYYKGYEPENAVDRNYDTKYDSGDQGNAWPWLEVQLANKGLVQDVRMVTDHYRRIKNAHYCGGELMNAEVRVGESRVPLNHRGPIIREHHGKYLCGRYEGSAWDGTAVRISCGEPLYGEYVTVQLMDPLNTARLSLQEIEIYETGIRYIMCSY